MYLNALTSLFTAALLVFPSIAFTAPCKTKPPVLTAEEAECAIETILYVQSCASIYGFKRTSEESKDSWVVVVTDLNPDKTRACREIQLRVCKKSGEVIRLPSDAKCTAHHKQIE